MNTLTLAKRTRVLSCLIEGCSILATVRMTGVAKNTIVRLLGDVGEACTKFHDEAVRNLTCKRVQCDEIWNFCYCKQKNVPIEKQGKLGYGDCYTWVAIDADTKLVLSFLVGKRDAEYGKMFMNDVAARINGRVQLSTDGHAAYLEAVESAFGGDVDYAMLIKLYGAPLGSDSQRRYSPVGLTGIITKIISGDPNTNHISTSFVERQNLTMRMSMRRFTRLSNGFSKKIENLEHSVALHFMHYNFVRIHKSLRVTPAMEAGLTDHVWSLEDIANLAPVEAPKKRGPYKKRVSN